VAAPASWVGVAAPGGLGSSLDRKLAVLTEDSMQLSAGMS
jgi:hypothetical protein